MFPRRIVWALVFFALIQAGLWPTMRHRYQHFVLEGGAGADTQIANQIASDHSQVLLLGNSFLGEGVDVDLLAQRSQIAASKAAMPGSTTPTWFLVLKNVIAPMPAPPRAVVLFFVDSHATWPDYNLDGNYHLIRQYALPDEPLLAQRLFYDRSTWVEEMATQWLPSYRFRHNAQKDIYWLASYWLGLTLGFDWQTVNFGEDKWSSAELRDAELETASQLAQWPAERLDFAHELPASLLPEMLQVAQQEQIQLIFVRMPRRRDYAQAQPAELAQYIEQLGAYLASHNAVLLDFAGVPQLDEHSFGVGDHLNAQGRAAFTELLAVELPRVLQRPWLPQP